MQVIFTEFWAFIAALILIGAVFDGLAKCVRAWRGRDED